MPETARTKQEIVDKLGEFTATELQTISTFIDFLHHRRQRPAKKRVTLQGILKDTDLRFSDVTELRKQTWRHLEQEFVDG